MTEPTRPVIRVELTHDLRDVALDYIVHHLGGDSRLEGALHEWRAGESLSTSFRLEADLIVVIAQALRHRAYLD